jgi:hypothetical protein
VFLGKNAGVQWVLLGGVLVLLLAALAIARNVRRGRTLRAQFGPEYQRVLAEQGNREIAELELEERRRRRMELEIRAVSERERARYLHWLDELRAGLDDHPQQAVAEIDALVLEVMHARGYPAESFSQSVADISVDHPDAAQDYRAARALATREVSGDASTERLKTAFRHYEALAHQLLVDESAREHG